MMKIQILGSGCDKCRKLASNAKIAAERLNRPFEIEKIDDINQITAFGVMMTPALAVNGKLVSSGKVLTPEEITDFLAAPSCDCGGRCASSEKKTAESPCCCGTPTESAAPCCCGKTSEKESVSCCEGGSNKKIMTIVLLFFVAASIVFMLIKETQKTSSAAPPVEAEQSPPALPRQEDALIVYYFHGNQRDMSCNKIEELTKLFLEKHYAGEVATGKIIFQSVNMEDAANEHFVKDFKVSIGSIAMVRNGRFEKFDAVWTLVREPEKFQSYIRNGIKKMMEDTFDK